MARKRKSAERPSVDVNGLVEDPTDVAALMKCRDEARANKNWAVADAIRDHLQNLGYGVQDVSGAKQASELVKDASKRLKKQRKKERRAAAAAQRLEEERKERQVVEMRRKLEKAKEDAPAAGSKPRKLARGVTITDLVIGQGKELSKGRSAKVSYRGTLDDGTVFDQSSKFTFQLGVGEVIKGWDIGMVGMKKGGKRKIVCPPGAAYGKRKIPGIPPNSTLTFVVTAL